MKEFIGPQRVRIRQARTMENLRDLLNYCLDRDAEGEALLFRKTPFDESEKRSYRELAEDIYALGEALLFDPALQTLPPSAAAAHEGPAAAGLRRHRIAILGENRYEWILAHNAAAFGAGLSVPLDKQLSPPEVINLLRRAHASVFFLDADKKEILEHVLSAETDLRRIILFGSASGALVEELRDERLAGFDAYLDRGRSLRRGGSRRHEQSDIDPNAPMAIYFTSGTTAQSKGVLLSHRNVLSDAVAAFETVDIMSCRRGLSVLPLHHTFENTVGIYCYWLAGITLCLSDGLHYLLQNLKEWDIEIMITVPLMLERIESMAKKSIRRKGLEAKIQKAFKLSAFTRRFGLDLRRTLFASLLEQLAPKLHIVIVGAAALRPSTQRFFNDIGINTYGGYGLTETAPVLSCCNRQFNKIGSVGQPVHGVRILIDSFEKDNEGHDIGEILAQGPNVMLGYYENSAATDEVLENGLFRTGDIGYLDKDGVIYITGRAKSMIVLQNGKKLFPEESEALLNRYDGVASSMVFQQLNAQEKDEICARLCLEKDRLPEGIESDDQIAEYLEKILGEVNAEVAAYKAIQYVIWNEEAPVMTATLKIKRAQEQAAVRDRLAAAGKTVKDLHLRRF